MLVYEKIERLVPRYTFAQCLSVVNVPLGSSCYGSAPLATRAVQRSYFTVIYVMNHIICIIAFICLFLLLQLSLQKYFSPSLILLIFLCLCALSRIRCVQPSLFFTLWFCNIFIQLFIFIIRKSSYYLTYRPPNHASVCPVFYC